MTTHLRRIPNTLRNHDESAHSPEPNRKIVADLDASAWCYVRLVEVPDGRFVSIEAKEILMIGELGLVPSVCAGSTRDEIDKLIAELVKVRELL
jgi:hypothetical protein